MTNNPKSLRDEFAIAALVAMGLPPADMMAGNMVMSARRAYAWADVMMAERDTDQKLIELSVIKHRI